ncbi:unnamed protein product (macronuclear) [Paramecium tetraurelia]|uniref:Uncharacterized protein n=1 Tax=Paramecium tetraurelia TaxID=5888 RepID=A0BZI0_PARTE|nr:uncharacterized protein GSPATT00033800001 [Paramecium tetraurelia]CAK63947.1 unnamed protein product [Paramecium tetraurelia]|eukprot:XP_001431345.1 hypothetical protein (macronuclear) [Paramecium tetraurelia strain d4-2]
MDSINTCLFLLNEKNEKESECTKDELNDSIDLYVDSKISEIERRVVRYLHDQGIQTKTDPGLKQQRYWNLRRIESNKQLEQFWSQPKLSLNSSVSRLLSGRESSLSTYFHKSGSSLQAFLTS